MSLLDVVRSGVALANKITRDLQPVVSYQRLVSTDGEGAKTYAAAVPLHAIVDYTSKQVRTQGGVMTVTRATIDLPDVKEIIVATGGAGIGNDDVFTLPDGDTGPILDIGGFIDAGTGNPVATKVMIG
jgi:hypothetical protein